MVQCINLFWVFTGTVQLHYFVLLEGKKMSSAIGEFVCATQFKIGRKNVMY